MSTQQIKKCQNPELKGMEFAASVLLFVMLEIIPNRPRSSICLIRWWFGEFPPYMDCLMRSCEANPDIDWLILTDNQTPRKFPPNVRLKHTNLNELRELFSGRLGFTVELPCTDLLPVFKPAFGFFFEELLNNYNFWGCCDFDMIFGDLRKFLREEILTAYDKILNRGHLMLYRNTPEVNRYFMLEAPGCANYRQAFQNPKAHPFDEWRGIYLILRYHNIPQFHDEFIVDVVPPTKWKITRFEGTAIRNRPKQVFYWHKGKVFHAYLNCDGGIVDDEYAYIHFQKRPMPPPRFNADETDGFLITPDGFFPYNREPLTPGDFERYNRAHWRSSNELLRAVRKSLRRRLGFK